MNMPLDVLHHNNRVINHQADREHNRQQSQKIDGETRHQHQENSPNQRNRNGDDRDQHRPE